MIENIGIDSTLHYSTTAHANKGKSKPKSFLLGGGGESDYSVCPHPLRQFYTCFMPVYFRQEVSGTPFYFGFHQFMSVGWDVELNSILSFHLPPRRIYLNLI